MFLAPTLTPHGHLVLVEDSAAAATDSEVGQRLRDAFARGPGHGLLQLGAGEAGTAIPAVFSYWREFSARYVTRLCSEPHLADASAKGPIPPPTDAELDSLVLSVPPMNGAEYLTPTVIDALSQELENAFRLALSECGGELTNFLTAVIPREPGRPCALPESCREPQR
jgi:non-specific serine/threonine protein kinase